MGHHIIAITGASGTGKTTVSAYLERQYQVARVITHTTRPKRPGEQDGVDYYFETAASFPHNHYLEHVTYSGYQYGSSYEALDRAFAQSDYASIVLDTQGAITYIQALGAAVSVLFLTIDDPHILQTRLLERGDDPAMVAQRLNSAEYRRDLTLPAALRGKAQVIVNDQWPAACVQLDAFFKALQVKAAR